MKVIAILVEVGLVLICASRIVCASIQVDTTPSWSGTSAIGISGAPAYGQTFSVNGVDTILDQFRVFFSVDETSSPFSLSGFVMHWSGSKADGPILYQGEAQNSGTGGQLVPFTFDTGGLVLAAGNEYVFYVTSTLGQYGLIGITSGTDSYAGGQFVAATQGQNLTTENWYISPGGLDPITSAENDLAFVATFSATSLGEVPEPASLIVWSLLGLAGIGAAWRRSMAA